MLQSRPNSDHQSQIQQMSRSSGTVVRSGERGGLDLGFRRLVVQRRRKHRIVDSAAC
jgi:hypothetical protein